MFLTLIKSKGGEGFEEEHNEFLFVICAGKVGRWCGWRV